MTRGTHVGLDYAVSERIDQYQCLKRPLAADDLVGAILFLVSPDSDFISGQILTVDGGLANH